MGGTEVLMEPSCMKSLNDTGQRFENWGLMLLFSFGRTSCLEHHRVCTSRNSVLLFPNRGVWAA